MSTPDPIPAVRQMETTTDYQNIVFSLQLLTLYAEPYRRTQLQLLAIRREAVPTFEVLVHALTRLRN